MESGRCRGERAEGPERRSEASMRSQQGEWIGGVLFGNGKRRDDRLRGGSDQGRK